MGEVEEGGEEKDGRDVVTQVGKGRVVEEKVHTKRYLSNPQTRLTPKLHLLYRLGQYYSLPGGVPLTWAKARNGKHKIRGAEWICGSRDERTRPEERRFQ